MENHKHLDSKTSHLALPNKLEEFQDYHYRALRRLNKSPLKFEINGLLSLQVNIPKFIPVLREMELLSIVTYPDSLFLLKNDSLKTILKTFGLKVSGAKKELVNRIVQEIDESDVRLTEAYSDVYVCTELGQKVLEESIEILSHERLAYLENILSLIQQKQLNKAYRMICKTNADKPVQPGLNCNWSRCYQEGLNPQDEELYLSFFECRTDINTISVAIYEQMSGDSACEIPYNRQHRRYLSKVLSTERNFNSYIHSGIEKYRFLAALDDCTCKKCGSLDGKIFLVKNRRVGVNCPPIHDGCRCTTVAAIDGHRPPNRCAKNPITGESSVIEYLTFNEWKKNFRAPSTSYQENSLFRNLKNIFQK